MKTGRPRKVPVYDPANQTDADVISGRVCNACGIALKPGDVVAFTTSRSPQLFYHQDCLRPFDVGNYKK